MKKILYFSLLLGTFFCTAQSKGYWQQKVDYKMDVSMNVETYQYKGKQKLVYTNNSSDTLRKVYYHLFNNAFQPGSEMDVRSQTIADPDGRFIKKIKTADGKEIKESRIANLKPNETGYLKILNFLTRYVPCLFHYTKQEQIPKEVITEVLRNCSLSIAIHS